MFASNNRLVKLENENKILNGKLRNAEESEVESIDIIQILENTLKNREHDVERLNGEIMDLKNEKQKLKSDCEIKDRAKDVLDSDEDMPSTSKCGQCDYESDGESDGESEMKTHLESHHELRCNICDFTCFDKSDLVKSKRVLAVRCFNNSFVLGS